MAALNESRTPNNTMPGSLVALTLRELAQRSRRAWSLPEDKPVAERAADERELRVSDAEARQPCAWQEQLTCIGVESGWR